MFIYAKYGRSNIEQFEARLNGVGYDLTGVTKIEAVIGNHVISTETGSITVDGSKINICFDDFNLPAGRYFPELLFYKGSNPKPETMAAKGRPVSIILEMQ